MKIKVILTGATGMVGEGVLFECLSHPDVEQILMINRRPYPLQHPKLKECIVSDFFRLEDHAEQLKGYNACFYCAGVSSVGMKEAEYSRITYDTVLHVAQVLVGLNPGMVICHISGSHTDSSEKGKVMWARVKGRAENGLMRLPFKGVYNFRPGFMNPTPGQKNIKGLFKVIAALFPLVRLLIPSQVLQLRQVGMAMINAVLRGYPKQVLEVKDIQVLAGVGGGETSAG